MVRSRGGGIATGSGMLHERRAAIAFPPPIWPGPGRSRDGDVGALVSVLRRHHLSLSALELSPACMSFKPLRMCEKERMNIEQLLSWIHMHGMLVCRLLESMHQEVTQQDPSTHVEYGVHYVFRGRRDRLPISKASIWQDLA